jgi:hypothetical protein
VPVVACALEQGMVKLRLALRSLARLHSDAIDVGEVAWFGSDRLRRLFNITEEPGRLAAAAVRAS